MIDGYDNGGRGLASEVANWRDCDALERAIEVPMLEPMRIARDDRRFIAVYVVRVIAVTVRVVMLAVVMFVMRMVRFIGVHGDDGRADSFRRDADDERRSRRQIYLKSMPERKSCGSPGREIR